jgi:signal peptidase I
MQLKSFFKKSQKPLFSDGAPNPVIENIRTIIFAVVIAVLFRSFFFEPFHIPSGSMKSGLREGDFILVSKFSYGYSKYSFPFGIVPIADRIFASEPEAGDVVVFRLPEDPKINYIKRLVGKPGDEIQVRMGVLYINDEEVVREKLKEPYADNVSGFPKFISEYVETMPNGKSYNVLDEFSNGAVDNAGPFFVPEDHYFFMGDNRDNSQDSRYLGRVGFVPRRNIVGKASFIFMSSSESLIKFWKWPMSIRFKRIFHKIE